MTTQERRLVQSEIGALKKMLARLPESSVIERMSLEARKRSLEGELASQRQAGAEEVPPGYKRTEVGVIPEDWEVKPLGMLGQFKNGINKDKDDFGHGFPLVNLMDVFGIPTVTNSVSLGRVNASEVERRTYDLRAGDVLFVRSSVKPEGVGLTTLITRDLPDTVFSGFLIRYRTNDQLVPEFKEHCFWEGDFRRRLISNSTVSANTNINQNVLKTLPLTFPPNKPEQRAIAAALSDADGLIGALDALIAKKRAIKQAAMQQLLTGKKRLPGFSGEWEKKRLGEATSIRNQKVLPSNVDPDTLCVELEYIGQGDGRLLEVSIAQNSTSSKYRFFTEDVLFGRLRSYLRKFWYADRDGICTTEIWPLMADASLIDSRFLYAIVQSDRFIEAASISYGTHMPRADWNVMKNFEIHLPPLPEQTAIAAVLSDMDAEIAALERRREKAEQIKQGMMQQLLTGRVRLVEPPEAAA